MRFTPLRITLIYFVFALIWITTTDRIVEWFVDDVALLTQIQTAKGFFYITVTAIALYWMVKMYEKSLEKKQELQNEIFSAIPALITVYKPNLSEFSVNTEFEKTTGWKNSELSAVNIMEKVYPDSEYRKEVEEFMLNPNGRWKDFQLTTKSGENIQTTWTNVRLSDETQIGIGFDITERKKIETKLKKNEEWLQLATTSAGVGLWEWNPQTGEVIIDHVWANLVGYAYNELEPISIETWNKLVHPDDLIKFDEEVQKYFDGEKPIYECEVRMKHKKGHWVWILDRGRIIEHDDEGKPLRLVGTHVDITHRKQIEQKLEAEREFFRITSNLASDVIYNWNALNNTVMWSDGIHDVFGFSKDQVGDKLEFWERNIHPEDRDRVTESLDNAMKSDDKIWVKEYRFFTSAGETKYVRDKAFIFRDKNGNITRMVGAIVDLTDEKKANEFLRYHANLLSEMSDAVISTDENYHIKIWNHAAEKIYGWQNEEVIGKPIDDILGDYIKRGKKHEISQLLAENGEWSGEIIQKTKEGNSLNILSSVRQLKDKDDNLTGLIIINRNITEQIRIDKEKRLLADLFIRSNTGLAVSNHQTGKLERVNKAFADLFGYKMQEMIGMNMDSLYAEKSLQNPTELTQTLNQEEFNTFESELIKKDGSTFTALINLALVKDRYGESEYRISTIQDISELKKQQTELQKSRDRLLQAQQIAKLGYWSIDLENNALWWSDIVYEIYQQEPDSFEPTLDSYLSIVHPEDRKRVEEAINKNMESKRFTLNHRILKDNQDTGYVQIRGERRFDEDLNREILSGTVLDITETKKIEKQLEDEQKRFEIAANITSDVIWEWNPAIGQLWWGEGMETVLGYKKEDYEGNPRFWHAKIAKDDQERVISSMEHAEDSGAISWSENYLFHAADGSIRQIADSALILRYENGEIYRVIGAMVDKTKELEYQNALREQGHKFEMIAKSSNDVLYDRNFETNEVWWSEGWQTRFNFKEDEIVYSSEWWQQHIHPDERNRVADNLNRAIKANDDAWSEYYKFKNGRGEYSVVVDKGYFIKNEDGNIYAIVGTISDITADIRAKEELKASEEQYRLLFEQSPLPMFIYDPSTLNFVTANNSTMEKYGYSIEELRQMKIYDLHPESDHKAIKKEISENLKQKNTGFDVWTQVSKTGEKIIAEISGTEIFYEGRVLRLVIANDITEQKKAEERAISAIVEGEERERQRIAKELHDGLGQYLTASNMNLTSVYEDLKNIPAGLSRAFETGLEFLNHAISETRNISQNLLPKAIQDYGLELAAESLVNHLSNNNEIEFHFYKNLGGVKISDKIQINLYRILQEGLNNAIRHGKPKKIDVQLVYSDGEILMTIEDNGIAFDPKNMKNEGIGIRSMKTRAGAMSASFDILSSENRGTIISVVVPIQ
jgi:PAS domain S-box-containing protein